MMQGLNKLQLAGRTTLLSVALLVIGHPAVAGEEGLTNLQNAKVAYQIAKQRMLQSRKTPEEREADAAGEDQSCGAVDIGNVRNERGARAPREVITVVKGDVINTGRCR